MSCEVGACSAVGVKVVDPEDDSGEGSPGEMDRFSGKIGFLEVIGENGVTHELILN
jgi:hypothetical protein